MNAVERERHEEKRFLAQPATPKSERRRWTYGSLLFGPPDASGLCSERKCVKKEGHQPPHWPV